MNRASWLDARLGEIPFPGEDEDVLDSYLRSRDFTERVVDRTKRTRMSSARHRAWALLFLWVLLAVILYGLVPSGLGDVELLAVHVLLGVVLTLAVAGWAATLDPFRVLLGERRDVGEPERDAEAEAEQP